jgi:hypothetical protein
MMSRTDLSRIADHYQQHGEQSLLTQIGEWLDSSKISELNLCPRKYYYRHERHLVPLSNEGDPGHWANPMTFGHALHAALASYYDGSAFRKETCPCPDVCRHCQGKPIPRIIAQFLINYPWDPDDPKDPRTRDRGIEIISVYLGKWQREPFKVVGVECSFALDFGEFTYIGRIDLLKEESGKLAPLDHKSTTRFGMIFEQQFKLSHQMTGYMRGVEKITGEPVTEGEINALRITSRIDVDESFARMTTTRTPEDFEEWEFQVRQAFEEIKRFRSLNYWPMRAPFACSAYNRTCEYYNLCTTGASRREEMITRSFMHRPWTPLDE